MAGNPNQIARDPELGASTFDEFLTNLIAEFGVKPAKAFEGTPPENDYTNAPAPAKGPAINSRMVLGAGLFLAAFAVAR